jgi:hypothetical protein
MPREPRLRARIQHEAANMAPDVTGRLEATLRNGRRRSRRRQVRAALAFGTVILAVVLVGPPLIDALRNREPQVGASPSPSPTASLTGAYATTLVSTDVAVTSNRMAGDWTIGFGSSQILTVTAPPAFTGTYSGYSFDVAGSHFTTDLFGEDVCSTLLPGTYRWSLSSGQLTFTVVDDSCPGRVALLTSAAWNATTAR